MFAGLNITDAPPSETRLGRMMIGGKWEYGTGGDWLEVVSPATGEIAGYLPLGTRADAQRAIAAANAAKPKIAGMSIWERSALCLRIADEIDKRAEEIAHLLALEQGKPFHRDAKGEAGAASAAFRMWAEQVKWLETGYFPVQDGNKRAFSTYQPRGVYGLITPWNFPLGLPVIYLAPGLAAGNSIVWVPAPTTSLVTDLFMQCLMEAGVPDGVVNTVTGLGSEVGDEVVVNPGTQAISFTGSSATGKTIATRGAGKPMMLELGGNGPTVVLADADVDVAARKVAAGCFANAGQICTATERILVDRKIYDRFVAAVVAEAGKVKLGPAFDPETTMGALNNEPVATKVDKHLEEARARGAEILCGGGRATDLPTRLYYQPTVIANPPADSLLNVDETFGPVAPIMPFDGDDDLFKLASASSYGLSGALFTKDVGKAFRYAEKIKCGIVNVNEMSCYWEMHIPAGGASGSNSGIGRTGGRHTLAEMSDMKTITIDLGA